MGRLLRPFSQPIILFQPLWASTPHHLHSIAMLPQMLLSEHPVTAVTCRVSIPTWHRPQSLLTSGQVHHHTLLLTGQMWPPALPLGVLEEVSGDLEHTCLSHHAATCRCMHERICLQCRDRAAYYKCCWGTNEGHPEETWRNLWNQLLEAGERRCFYLLDNAREAVLSASLGICRIWVQGNMAPFNFLPIKPSLWKCKANIRLGTMFTLFYLEERMDACHSPDILAVWTAF